MTVCPGLGKALWKTKVQFVWKRTFSFAVLLRWVTPAKNLEDIKVDVIVTNIEGFIFYFYFYEPATLSESLRWNCSPQGGMKVTFWLSRNNSSMQEFSVLRVWGEHKILWSDGFQRNERYLTLGVELRHPPIQSLCLRPPQTHTLLLCSPELPDSWVFSIYSVPQGTSSWRCDCSPRVPVPAEVWQHRQPFGGQIYLQYLHGERVFPSPRTVPVLMERCFFLI